MHQFLNTVHSYNRYLILAALAAVLFLSIKGWLTKGAYGKADNAAGAALLGFAHLQLLVGLIQYFVTSPYTQSAFADFGAAMKNPWLRYFAVEHIFAMVLAVVLIQLGRTFSKRKTIAEQKHKTVAIYTIIATLLIVGSLASKGIIFGSPGSN